MPALLTTAPIAGDDFARAEPVLERLDLAGEALTNLVRICGGEEDDLRDGDRWAARVTVDDTALLVRAEGERWAIFAPGGADEADAALAARKLHGLLGATAETWDHDR